MDGVMSMLRGKMTGISHIHTDTQINLNIYIYIIHKILDGKNPAPSRMPENVFYPYVQDFFHQPYLHIHAYLKNIMHCDCDKVSLYKMNVCV